MEKNKSGQKTKPAVDLPSGIFGSPLLSLKKMKKHPSLEKTQIFSVSSVPQW
jgi:hypothetical protein